MIPGVVAGGMRSKRRPTIWDAEFNANGSVTESGRLASISDPPGGHVQSVFGASVGRWYFEVTGVSGLWACGIAKSNLSPSTNTFTTTSALSVYGASVYQNGVIGSVSASSTYGIEFLCSTGQVWVHSDAGIPAGPFTLSALDAGESYKAVMIVGGSGLASARINAGQDAFVHGLPSGCQPIFGGF